MVYMYGSSRVGGGPGIIPTEPCWALDYSCPDRDFEVGSQNFADLSGQSSPSIEVELRSDETVRSRGP
jgi:hypothetical protein